MTKTMVEIGRQFDVFIRQGEALRRILSRMGDACQRINTSVFRGFLSPSRLIGFNVFFVVCIRAGATVVDSCRCFLVNQKSRVNESVDRTAVKGSSGMVVFVIYKSMADWVEYLPRVGRRREKGSEVRRLFCSLSSEEIGFSFCTVL